MNSRDLLDFVEYASDDSEVEEVLIEHFMSPSAAPTPRLNIWTLHDSEFKLRCRFEKQEFTKLVAALELPPVIRTRSRCSFDPEDALFITLRRFAYPNRLFDLCCEFGRTQSQLSECVDAVCNVVYRKWHHLLVFEESRFGVDRLRQYADATAQAGCPLPRCIGFIDGTLRPNCRPKVGQREVYSGHKRVHGLKFQAVVTPDGIISHLAGPFEGRRHDSVILTESNLLRHTEARLRDNNGYFTIYGDAAYPISPTITSPFVGAKLSAEESAFNSAMSKHRIAVEWGFGKICQMFAFLDFKKNLKILLQPVGKYYAVACILINCHTCAYGSAVTEKYFALRRLSMNEYLRRR